MILVWGSMNDSPVASVLTALRARAASVIHFDDDALGTIGFDFVLGPSPTGWIDVRGRRIEVSEIQGIYLRPGEPERGDPARTAQALLALASVLPRVVLNRPAAGQSNHAKPYQLGLIAQAGFDIPATLVTTDPAVARSFLREHGRIAYKSLSGIRSIVGRLDSGDEARLDDVRSGPVQLQAWVDGVDVRVHVVGEQCFACAVQSPATDYRYASAQGETVELSEIDLPDPIGRRIVALAHGMGLRLAGVDLRRTPDGSWICFEVNPSPGFTWYEDATGHPIAAAIAAELSAG